MFSIDSAYFTVKGTYYFRNTTNRPVSVSILYPVSKSGSMKAIDTLIVYDNQNPGVPLRTFDRDTLYTFQMEIAASGSKDYTIAYRQKHNGNTAKYILTTTSFWGQPLEEGKYDLWIPDYIRINEFSYPPDNFTEFDGEMIYHWEKTDFMPDNDFIIRFNVDY
jgi:hypothetical protein